jgi:hypothetical protein
MEVRGIPVTIDLLPNCDEIPNAETIIDSISPALGEVEQALGLGAVLSNGKSSDSCEIKR